MMVYKDRCRTLRILQKVFLFQKVFIVHLCEIFDFLGVSTPALDPKSEWDFHPNPWKVGDNVTGGVCNCIFILGERYVFL
jgi:hypothetical protein